ncbi:MAG: CBS domain-containing protein [Turneriella sp.]|nr:CBS domain-containing protein [Leptospiraceae bacterium]MCX7632899.1 CBS domain-containing protein [Turneriella sp.]
MVALAGAMVVMDVLKTKTYPMPVIRQNESVLAAVRQMLAWKETGLLIVTPQEEVVGIITEKDIMRLVAERYTQLDKIEVWEVMSKGLKTIEHSANIEQALELMTSEHIHHLPVTKEGKTVGLISLDNIVWMRLRMKEDEARALKDFITHY